MQAIGVVDLRDCGQAIALQQSDQERHLVDVDVLMLDAMFVEEFDCFGAEGAEGASKDCVGQKLGSPYSSKLGMLNSNRRGILGSSGSSTWSRGDLGNTPRFIRSTSSLNGSCPSIYPNLLLMPPAASFFVGLT